MAFISYWGAVLWQQCTKPLMGQVMITLIQLLNVVWLWIGVDFVYVVRVGVECLEVFEARSLRDHVHRSGRYAILNSISNGMCDT